VFEPHQWYYTICEATHVEPSVKLLPAELVYEPVKQIYLLGKAAFNANYAENMELNKTSRKRKPSKLNTQCWSSVISNMTQFNGTNSYAVPVSKFQYTFHIIYNFKILKQDITHEFQLMTLRNTGFVVIHISCNQPPYC